MSDETTKATRTAKGKAARGLEHRREDARIFAVTGVPFPFERKNSVSSQHEILRILELEMIWTTSRKNASVSESHPTLLRGAWVSRALS